MSRGPTLKSVAAAAGVSTATMSYAFDRPDRLSTEARTRILAVARDLGYAGPDAAARSLRTGRTDRASGHAIGRRLVGLGHRDVAVIVASDRELGRLVPFDGSPVYPYILFGAALQRPGYRVDRFLARTGEAAVPGGRRGGERQHRHQPALALRAAVHRRPQGRRRAAHRVDLTLEPADLRVLLATLPEPGDE